MINFLAWKNTWHKPLSSILSILLLSCSVAIITVLILVQKQIEDQLLTNANNVDLVLGATGSPLQLVLSSVYHIDAPTGNIPYDSAKIWMQHPFVKTAIPLAFGDNYLGYKILGTTPDYLKKYQAKIAKGKMYQSNFEVVIGATVAQKLQLKIGSTFYSVHGHAQQGEKHEQNNYIVTGILMPTGKIIDNLIICSIPSVWAIHQPDTHTQDLHTSTDHTDQTANQITSVLLEFKTKMAIITWPRLIAQNTKMQVASPAIEINRLFNLFGIGIQTLQFFGYGIFALSGVSIFIALYNQLKERNYEFALLRIYGSTPLQLSSLVLLEGLFLSLIGFLLGTIVGYIGLQLITNIAQEDYKMSFNPYDIQWQEQLMVLLVTLLVAILAALIPALKAYRLNISQTITQR